MRTEKQLANLKPKTTLTKEEAKKLGSNGGKKSVEKRRQLKTWKEILSTMLNTPATEKQVEALEKYGIDKDDATIQSAILYQHILGKAIQGDKWAIEKLAQFTENNGTQKVEVSGNVTDIASRISEYAKGKKS